MARGASSAVAAALGALCGAGLVLARERDVDVASVTEPRAAAAAAAAAVRTGLEELQRSGWAQLRTAEAVGWLTNPTGVLPDLTHGVDAAVGNVPLVAVFGPEHGFRGTTQDGKSEGTSVDARTGLPVYDAYAKPVPELQEMFRKAGIDTLVFDIQDVGVRFYTFIWSLYDAMVACAGLGIRVVVLDRPNPLGGVVVEGPLLKDGYASFVGRKPIALRHGMTVGELAGLFNRWFVPGDAGGKAVHLDVVRMAGWRRDMVGWHETGQPWVLPSPNMPTPATALVYPGMGLIEGTNVSEGRGTTVPFEMIGAPWLVDNGTFADAMRRRAAELPGRVTFREAYFEPTGGKHAGKTCGGIQVFVGDPATYRALPVALSALVEMRARPGFGWREDNYVDKLYGSARLRELVDAGAGVDEIVASWQEDLTWFIALRAPHLLYPDEL